MIFRQVLHSATGCASYVFGCTGKKALAVVDAHQQHVDDYLALASLAQSPIVAIIETHVQADHLSGAPTLAERTGAPIYLGELEFLDLVTDQDVEDARRRAVA